MLKFLKNITGIKNPVKLTISQVSKFRSTFNNANNYINPNFPWKTTNLFNNFTNNQTINNTNHNSRFTKFTSLKYFSSKLNTNKSNSDDPEGEEDSPSPPRKNVDHMFHKDSESSSEFLPIKKKIEDLIAENEEYKEYNRILNMTKNLQNEFDLDKFREVVNYISDNQVTDVFLFKQFESIFIKNLNMGKCIK